LARLRKLAGGGARVGFLHGLRFAVRGPPGGPELLILHGLGDSIAGWARVLGPLSRTHRVHIVDLPGHGLSAPPADFRLGTLLEPVARYAAGLRSPLLVGHSLGGWLAARLALRPQTSASGLLLVNPAGAVLPAAEWAGFRQLLDTVDARAYLERAFHPPPAAARPCYPAGGLVRADARWLPSWTSWRRDLAPPPAQRTDGPRRREPRRAGRRAAGLGARGKRRRAPRRGRPGASPRAHAVQGDRAPRTGRDRAHHRGVRRRDQRLDELRPDRLPRGGRQPVPGAGPGRPRRRDHLGGVRPRRAAAR